MTFTWEQYCGIPKLLVCVNQFENYIFQVSSTSPRANESISFQMYDLAVSVSFSTRCFWTVWRTCSMWRSLLWMWVLTFQRTPSSYEPRSLQGCSIPMAEVAPRCFVHPRGVPTDRTELVSSSAPEVHSGGKGGWQWCHMTAMTTQITGN